MSKSSIKEEKQSTHQAQKSQQKHTILAQFIKIVAQNQRKIEIIREILAEDQCFTPSALFHKLDTENKGHLIQKDIENYLVQLKINYKNEEIIHISDRMCEKNEKIGLNKFNEFILPNQNPRLRYFALRKLNLYQKNGALKINEKIQWLTSRLFIEIQSGYLKVKQIGKTLLNTYQCLQSHIFNVLSSNKKVISSNDLSQFMKNHDQELTRQQLGCLLKLMYKKSIGYCTDQQFGEFLSKVGVKKQKMESKPIQACTLTTMVEQNQRQSEPQINFAQRKSLFSLHKSIQSQCSLKSIKSQKSFRQSLDEANKEFSPQIYEWKPIQIAQLLKSDIILQQRHRDNKKYTRCLPFLKKSKNHQNSSLSNINNFYKKN